MILTTTNWATVENFSAHIAATNGKRPFAIYSEVGGAIVLDADEEGIDFSDDPETDTAIALDEVIHPLPSASAGVPCELCGEKPDLLGRCGCDY